MQYASSEPYEEAIVLFSSPLMIQNPLALLRSTLHASLGLEALLITETIFPRLGQYQFFFKLWLESPNYGG